MASTSGSVSRDESTPRANSWFSGFVGFAYDPAAGLRSNFNRLSSQRKWGGKLKGAQWAECQEAGIDRVYGTDTMKLEKWQQLCCDVYISNPPNSITGCKKVTASTLREQLLRWMLILCSRPLAALRF